MYGGEVQAVPLLWKLCVVELGASGAFSDWLRESLMSLGSGSGAPQRSSLQCGQNTGLFMSNGCYMITSAAVESSYAWCTQEDSITNINGVNTLVVVLPLFSVPLTEDDLLLARQAFAKVVSCVSSSQYASLLVISPNRVLSANDVDAILDIALLDEALFSDIHIWNASLDCRSDVANFSPTKQSKEVLEQYISLHLRQHLVHGNYSRSGASLVPLSFVTSEYLEATFHAKAQSLASDPVKLIESFNAALESLVEVGLQ